MRTEITDTRTKTPLQGSTPDSQQGWVLYDASCSFCTDLIARAEGALRAAGFMPEPLQSAGVRAKLNMPEDILLAEMRVLTPDGQLFGGADALVYLSRKLGARRRPWWAWLLLLASRIPFAMPLLRWGYARVAERRSCRRGLCPVRWPQMTGKEGTP